MMTATGFRSEAQSGQILSNHWNSVMRDILCCFMFGLTIQNCGSNHTRNGPNPKFLIISPATTKLTVAGYMTLVTPPHRSVTLDSHPLDVDTLDFDTLVSVTLDSDTKTLRILYGHYLKSLIGYKHPSSN